MSILGALGLGLNLVGGLAGLGSDKKKNRRASEQLQIDRDLANRQIDLSKYMEELSRQIMARGGNVTDPYGQQIGYDDESGTYRSPMRPGEVAVQDASDQEELARNTVDQEMRRRALQEAEGRRGRAGVEADQAQRDLSLFRQGIGAVDPRHVASMLRLSREGAINAGYDDAERAATTLSLRTGSSSVQDALAGLGRDRARARMEGIGAPELEGMQIADQMNAGRLGQRAGMYGLYSNQADKVYDAAFTPSNAADKSFDKSMAVQGMDLNRFGTALGGVGTAAAATGSAAAGQRQGFAISEANRVHAPTGNLLAGLGAMFGSKAGQANLGSMFGG